MSVIDVRLHRKPQPAVSQRLRLYCEIVHHQQYSALILIRDGDERRLRAMRQVAAWGDVIALSCFGDDRLNVLVYDDNASRAPDYGILYEKWPFGPVIVKA